MQMEVMDTMNEMRFAGVLVGMREGSVGVHVPLASMDAAFWEKIVGGDESFECGSVDCDMDLEDEEFWEQPAKKQRIDFTRMANATQRMDDDEYLPESDASPHTQPEVVDLCDDEPEHDIEDLNLSQATTVFDDGPEVICLDDSF